MNKSGRLKISSEVSRRVLIESGHRCAVCGEACPLERAHIIPWSSSRDNRPENLICLCANCHQRADHERWGEETLRRYKENPWVFRSKSLSDQVELQSRAYDPLRVLVARSRPQLGYPRPELPKEKKTKDPRSIEYKPEYYTDVDPDSAVIQKVFQEAGRNIICRVLDDVNKVDLADALTERWDIVHLDCVIGSNEASANVYLNDGPLAPQAFQELLNAAEVTLLVFMDCDSLRMVQSSFAANVRSLIAITGSLPVLAAERFCYGFYRSLARGKDIRRSFTDAKSFCAVELPYIWDSDLFVLNGDGDVVFS